VRMYYTDYTEYAIRNYCRMLSGGYTASGAAEVLKTNAERENWNACKAAFEEMTGLEQNVAIAIYGPRVDDFGKAIADYSERSGISKNDVWGICNKIVRMVARKRGLI